MADTTSNGSQAAGTKDASTGKQPIARRAKDGGIDIIHRVPNGYGIQDGQHIAFTKLMGDKLYFCPLPKHVGSVLDLATGSGNWAIDFVKDHPEARVTGVDVAEGVPKRSRPENFLFEHMDITKDWALTEHFDFIHARMLFTIQMDVEQLVSKVFNQLRPGGWFESFEFVFPFFCEDGVGPINTYWVEQLVAGLKALGHDWGRFQKLDRLLNEAGFVDVQVHHLRLEFGAWGNKSPDDAGMIYEEKVMKLFRPLMLGILGGGLGWSEERIDKLLAERHEEAMSGRAHTVAPIMVISGRRPE